MEALPNDGLREGGLRLDGISSFGASPSDVALGEGETVFLEWRIFVIDRGGCRGVGVRIDLCGYGHRNAD